MRLKVLIAPDKFKGTLSARAATEAMAKGWLAARPQDQVIPFPISDGGDGFGELLGASVGASTETIATIDAAHQPCLTEWWWDSSTRTAIVEAARVNGLARLPSGKYHPFDLDTFGLGAVLKKALAIGAQRCVVGIGGSATNDGGFGLALALGWTFFDEQGAAIKRWTDLHRLSRCEPPKTVDWPSEVLVAVDVQNPLLGPTGCARVYGPQKGLRPQDFELTDRCLTRLADVMERQLGHRTADEPGSGAAGGLGFGLCSFLGARLAPGFGLFANQTGLKQRLATADLVITGEGSIDNSTLMGKGVGELALLCRDAQIPCLGLGGYVPDRTAATQLFTQIHALTPDLTTRDAALSDAAKWLTLLAERAASAWTKTPGMHS